MNELVLPQSIQLPSSTIKHGREIYKICDFFFSVIANKTERILWTKFHEYTIKEGLDGARGVGYKCQLSVEIWLFVSCQLSF